MKMFESECCKQQEELEQQQPPGGSKSGQAGGESPEVLRCIPADKEYLIFLFHSCQLPTVPLDRTELN